MTARWHGPSAWLIAGCLLAAHGGPAAGQQQGPIQLFPELPPEQTPSGEGPGQAPPSREPYGEGPAESPPGGFQVEGLTAPAVDAIGLEGGLDPALWQDSDPTLVLKLLRELPVATHNPPLRDLTRRLLITGTNLPIEQSGRLLEARVDRLRAMGALEDAAGLLEQLPATDQASPLVRAAADVALLLGEDERACRRAQDVAPASEAPYWIKLTAYCRLRSGDVDGGRLAVGLLRERAASEDEAFFELADVLAGDRSGEVAADLSAPSPLHVAMLRAAELPLPPAALADPAPPLLAAIVRTPALAPDAGLELTERAFMAGALSAGELTSRYLETAPEEAAGGDVLAAITDDWGPSTRARALQRVREEQVAVARAELLDAVWLAADGPGRMLIARAFARPFAELPVDDGLVFVAPSVARALLGSERPVSAARWFALLRGDDGTGSQSQRAAASLAPLFGLAGVGGSQQVPQPTAETISAWRSASAAEREEAITLLTLLEGVSGPVAPSVWRDLLEPPFRTTTESPALPLWRLLEPAEAGQRRGEAVLIALHLLDGGPGDADPEAVVRGLRSLRGAGLDGEARAIAVAAALIAGV